MRRLVVFADPRSFIANVLVRATVDACAARPDIDLVAVCDTGRTPATPRLAWASRLAAKAVVKRLFDNAQPMVVHPPMWRTFHRDAGRAGISVITPDDRNINHPAFVSRLRRELRPDLALSLVCMQIFRDELLASFAEAVNYHNGLLPSYRGVRATGWSMYRGERRTGFSFHRMTIGIDEGPVLYSDTVPIRPRASALLLDWQKTELAARAIPSVLDAMLRDDPGSPQDGTAGYHSARDCDRITAVGDPRSVTWDDLTRRIRAFGAVEMTLPGGAVRVTKTKQDRATSGPLSFTTADGVTGRATRLTYLPPRIHTLYRRLRPARTELISLRDLALVVYVVALALPAWLLPDKLLLAVGRAIAWTTTRLHPDRARRDAMALHALLGDRMREPADRVHMKILANAHVHNMLCLRTLRPGGWKPALRVEGADALRRALDEGRGAVVWTVPMVYDGLMTKAALASAGFRPGHLSHMYHGLSTTRFGFRVLNRLVRAAESRHIDARFVMRPDRKTEGLRQLRRWVEDNGVATVTAVGGSGRRMITVNFLDGTLEVPSGAPELARRAGAALLVASTLREPDGSFVTHIEPIDDSVGEGRTETHATAAASFAAIVSDRVTEYQDQCSPVIYRAL